MRIQLLQNYYIDLIKPNFFHVCIFIRSIIQVNLLMHKNTKKLLHCALLFNHTFELDLLNIRINIRIDNRISIRVRF